MIDVRPATTEDARAAALSASAVYQHEHVLENAFEAVLTGDAATLSDHAGNIGVIAGMQTPWNGVAEFWAITTPFLGLHPVGYTRTLRRLLDVQVKKLKLHRVSMTVRGDYAAGHRWAKALGFTDEATLREYGPDKSDYVLYRRLF